MMTTETEPEIRTRAGYLPAESLKSFQTSLGESGVVATGRALHFAADMVCSGGLDVWIKAIWDFAIDHIGIASPRIFVYLVKRFKELDDIIKKYADDDLYQKDEFHTRIAEIVFVIRECPRRTRIPWPKVGTDTHRDGWLREVAVASETQVVRRVYKMGSDLPPLHSVACELMKACSDGATERVFFWIRWCLDEDSRLKKENHGSGLTSFERGNATMKGRARCDVGFFLADLFAEAYKDLANRNMIRMHEEFQTLLNLYRGAESRIGSKGRRDILAFMGQILCEVPRWKVPAAPSLIKDPITLTRAISQSGHFFKEVLAHPRVNLGGKGKHIFKGGKVHSKIQKQMTTENQIDAFEKAMEAYLNRS
jgi:hypothetical protein